jgi:phosphate transport system substrate-binding protein
MSRLGRRLAALGLAGSILLGAGAATPALAAPQLIGSGSSFAGIELTEWSKQVGSPPYNLAVNYQSSSSGQGRQNFLDGVVDFAVTDIRYNKFDVRPPPAGSFDYIPVTAGGVAIMYNLNKHGLGQNAKPLQLSSLTVCGIFTGSIRYWDDEHIAAENPGVTLPHVAVTPVVRSDPAGTNYVMEEYCLQLHHDLYSAFALAVSRATGTDYPPNEPTSNWPLLSPLVAATGSEGAADTVAAVNSDGYVTAVETGYATLRHFPVAAVKNDKGVYVLPNEKAVSTALSYATQQADGTHVLNFSPGNPEVYNPSTYSYMLVRLTGIDANKGAAMTRFAEYCLTIGQSGAAQLSYASIGRNLILYGLERLKAVPGYAAPTPAMLAAIPATSNPGGGGGATQTTTTAPASGGSAGTTGGTGTTAGSGGSTAVVAGKTVTKAKSTSGAATSAGAGGGSEVAAAIDPGADLGPDSGAAAPLGRTGVESDLLAAAGGLFLVAGEVGRRAVARRRRRS